MSDAIAEKRPDTTAKYEAAIDALLGEMQEIQARIEARRPRIQRLREERAVLRAETQAILKKLASKS